MLGIISQDTQPELDRPQQQHLKDKENYLSFLDIANYIIYIFRCLQVFLLSSATGITW